MEMEIVQILQDWVGLISLVLTGIVWWFVKLNSDKIKAAESAKQEVQHTQQEKLTTEEKDFELDSRRVKVAEEVASETLEHLADTREENLNLLEEVYKLKKGMVALNNKVDELIRQLEFANDNICFDEGCPKRRPPKGTYKGCKSKEEMNDGAELHS